MGKQFEFYSHKNDDEMIANTLRSVFGELLCVPHYKGDLSPFDICANAVSYTHLTLPTIA